MRLAVWQCGMAGRLAHRQLLELKLIRGLGFWLDPWHVMILPCASEGSFVDDESAKISET